MLCSTHTCIASSSQSRRCCCWRASGSFPLHCFSSPAGCLDVTNQRQQWIASNWRLCSMRRRRCGPARRAVSRTRRRRSGAARRHGKKFRPVLRRRLLARPVPAAVFRPPVRHRPARQLLRLLHRRLHRLPAPRSRPGRRRRRLLTQRPRRRRAVRHRVLHQRHPRRHRRPRPVLPGVRHLPRRPRARPRQMHRAVFRCRSAPMPPSRMPRLKSKRLQTTGSRHLSCRSSTPGVRSIRCESATTGAGKKHSRPRIDCAARRIFRQSSAPPTLDEGGYQCPGFIRCRSV